MIQVECCYKKEEWKKEHGNNQTHNSRLEKIIYFFFFLMNMCLVGVLEYNFMIVKKQKQIYNSTRFTNYVPPAEEEATATAVMFYKGY